MTRNAPDLPTPGVRRFLILVAILTLPFTLALTLNLRFPFKIYELALLGAGLTCLVMFRIPTLRSASRAAVPLMFLLLWALAVLLWHVWLPPAGLSTSGFQSRFGPLGDGLAKILYLMLSIFGFLQMAELTYREEPRVLRWWLIGAVAAALYSWYLFAASALGVAPLLLPGIESPQLFAFADKVVIRSGTFEEGNYLGLFLVTSTMVALYAKRLLPALFLGASVLVSFSTINFTVLTLISALLLWQGSARMSAGRRLAAITAGLLALTGLGVLLVGTGYVESVVAAKLVGSSAISRIERLGLAVSGLHMFADHPLAGVGISQYGYLYNAYEYLSLGALSVFFDEKRIPGNVYVELLAELGIVGFVLFVAFLVRVYQHLRWQEQLHLKLGFLAILLAWPAFPSYSIMFLWAFWGLIIGSSARLEEQETRQHPVAERMLAGIH